MKNKQLLTAALLLSLPFAVASAQETYYDITSYYLQNARFDKHIDYDVAATGDVKNTVKDVDYWSLSKASKTSLAVGATFEYGTAATFYGASIPSAGYDGKTTGACLTLSAALTNELLFYQDVIMPAAKYKFVVAYYNCNPASTAGTSLSGWVGSSSATSELTSFEYGKWLTDTIDFELSETTSGKLQVGLKAASGLTAKSAMLAIDFVMCHTAR